MRLYLDPKFVPSLELDQIDSVLTAKSPSTGETSVRAKPTAKRRVLQKRPK
jgi:hypothetical protein